MRITRGQLRRVIREEAQRLTSEGRVPSARTKAGAEHKILTAELQQLKKKLAGVKGRSPGAEGRRAAIRDDIARVQTQMRGLEEGRSIVERGRADFSDFADRTESYDQLVDAFQAAMDDTGDDFDSLVMMLRDDLGS